MSDTLNARNIRALHDTLKHEQRRTDQLFERLALLERQNAILRDGYNDLKAQVASAHARLAVRANGPTSR